MNAAQVAMIPVRMQEYVDRHQTAGVVTLVARHGKVASFEAVGYRDVENKKPMRKYSMFRIASLTKPITCAGIMILADEGKISVIDPIEKYLPEYKNIKVRGCEGRAVYGCSGTAPSRPINIEDLMVHTSGLEGSLPPSMLALTPGDLIEFDGDVYRIDRIEEADPVDRLTADRADCTRLRLSHGNRDRRVRLRLADPDPEPGGGTQY